ncbi:GNAT family N-acetyltransferase [Kitasatospora sp. NPDC004240]
MNSTHSTPDSDTGDSLPLVTRVTDTQWQAVQDDRPVGRGDAVRRPDGRQFVSIDAWQPTTFELIADAMVAALPAPLHTVVDEADHDAVTAWRRAGFTPGRREWGYLVPTDPRVTGLGSALAPAGVAILPAGEAEPGPLGELDRAVRAEVEATVGWQTMPAELLPCPAGAPIPLDPARFVVARERDRYVGLLRVAPLRQPRIGLIAVRADRHRDGIARALLAHVLTTLHHAGTDAAWAEVDESNTAATALFEGIGARRTGSTLELVRR